MKVRLMHRDRDLDLTREPPWNEDDLAQDLELETLLGAMAGGDSLVYKVSRIALFEGLSADCDAVLYRQAVLKDCLSNPETVIALFALSGEALEERRRGWFGVFYPSASGILSDAVALLSMLLGKLEAVRAISDEQAGRFESEGFTTLFAAIEGELTDAYLARIRAQLSALRFSSGVLVGAQLGKANEGRGYVLRSSNGRGRSWLARLLGRHPSGYTFRLHPRDDAGARILSDMRDRALNSVANMAAQSADHVLSFFAVLRAELAFYVGCLNLHATLKSLDQPLCFPSPREHSTGKQRFTDLADPCLCIRMRQHPVANSVNADGKRLVVITGANQGGKSTFLRSVGVAQLMMQAGMFVCAESFEASLCAGLVTHYKREEDATMAYGRFDAELGRISQIADHVNSEAMVLCNESFAATNEREGSEIAGQIVRALLEEHIRVWFVTHLFAFADAMTFEIPNAALFLRADRQMDGGRTFRLQEGMPRETSFAEDQYEQVFGAKPPPEARDAPCGHKAVAAPIKRPARAPTSSTWRPPDGTPHETKERS